jgi:hypothetical protein
VSESAIDVEISGFGLRLLGLTPALSQALAREWKDYVRAQVDSPALVIRVEDEDRAMKPGRFMDGTLEIAASPEHVRFRRDEGQMVQGIDTAQAVAHLAQGDEGRRFWGLVNLVCAAVGWRLLASGGGAVHAAGVLIDGSVHLLVGPSGSGKTTWARTASAAGLPILSDDCVLVDSSAGGLVALGTPFRSTDFPSPGAGRWPVATILIPEWAERPALAPASRLMVEARIAANLLFSAHAPEARSVAARAVSTIVSGATCRTLSFRPDGSWIDLLRESSAGR